MARSLSDWTERPEASKESHLGICRISLLMGALPARVTLVPLRSFWDRINHKNGHGVPDFEISAHTKVKLLEKLRKKGHK